MKILIVVFVVCLSMYTCVVQAADYPSSTTTPLAVDLDFNGKKITNIGDVVTKGPWADVRAYGAAGDGVTDDAAAIQSAIDAVYNAGGGIVFIPAPTSTAYIIGSTLQLKHHVTLRGVGPRTSVIKLKNSANVTMISGPTTGIAAFVTIENLGLDGNRANQTVSGIYGIDTSRFADFVLMRRLDIKEIKGKGIFHDGSVANGEGIILEDITVSLTSAANIYIRRTPAHVVAHRLYLGGDTTTNRVNGFTIEAGAQVFLNDCTFDGGGISPGNLASGINIEEDAVETNSGATEMRITNCAIFGVFDFGIVVNGGNHRGIYISNVRISSYGTEGIRLRPGASGKTISQIFITNCLTRAPFASATQSLNLSGAFGTISEAMISGNNFNDLPVSIGALTLTKVSIFNNKGINAAAGALIMRHYTSTGTWDPPSLADGAVASYSLGITGAIVGSIAYASHDQIGSNNIILSAHVEATDTVRVVLRNVSGTTLDIPSGTLRVNVWEY